MSPSLHLHDGLVSRISLGLLDLLDRVLVSNPNLVGTCDACAMLMPFAISEVERNYARALFHKCGKSCTSGCQSHSRTDPVMFLDASG